MFIYRQAAFACLALAAASLFAPAVLASEVQTVPIRQEGIVGELHYVPDAQHRTTVIMLNGSDGGIPSARDADDLARSGYTVLSLAYFKNWGGQPDGVPAALREIPLEYFYRAIDWLKGQPQVDRHKVVLMGQSRGAELALLLGSRRSDIAGVIAFSPSSYVWHAVGMAGAPAWTWKGKPVPYRASAADTKLSLYDQFVKAGPMAAARIPVEDIRAPVLLLSSKTDGVWPASSYADEITTALRSRQRQVQNVQFDDASHLLMGTGPGMTQFQIPGTTKTFDFGGTAEGNAKARAAAWSAVKQYLADLPSR
jgi:uncharacterized protein